MRPSTFLTIVICLAGSVFTWGMFALVGYQQNAMPYSIAWGCWDTAVYMALGILAMVYRERILASRCLVLCATLIAICSAIVLYEALHHSFVPRRHDGPTNCLGPIIEFGLPFLQWPCLFIFWIAAAVCNRCWFDSENLASADGP